MAFQLLEELCHQHGILAAGDAYANLISFFYEFVLVDRLCKSAPNLLFEFFYDAALDVRCSTHRRLRCDQLIFIHILFSMIIQIKSKHSFVQARFVL